MTYFTHALTSTHTYMWGCTGAKDETDQARPSPERTMNNGRAVGQIGSRWAGQLTIQRDDDDVAYARCEGVEGAVEWAG